MRTPRTVLTAPFAVLAFTLVFCADIQACWRSRCRPSCGPQYCGSWSSCQPVYPSSQPIHPYNQAIVGVTSCPDGYVAAVCGDGNVWEAASSADQADGCVDPGLLGQPCRWDTSRDKRLAGAKGTQPIFPMVCDPCFCVWRVAFPWEKPLAYFPLSYVGKRCR
jgi:hypothetical protein